MRSPPPTPADIDRVAPPTPSPSAPSPPPPDDSARFVGVGVVGAVGMAGIVGGGVLLSRAVSLHDEAATACPGSPFCPDDSAYDLANDARYHGNLATAAFVVGGAGLACSAFLLLTAPSLAVFDEAVVIQPHPGGVLVHGAF